MSRQQTRARQQAIAVGLMATLLVVAVYVSEGLDWLELRTLDLRFRYANSIPQRDDLICIDIDDEALDLVGRWPWPRDVQAGIIDVLHEAGLKTLLYDIELLEPETVRTLAPRDAELAGNLTDLLRLDLARALPDAELAGAFRRFGGAQLAFHYEGAAARSAPADLAARLHAWLNEDSSRWSGTVGGLFDEARAALAETGPVPEEELRLALRVQLSRYATLQAGALPGEAWQPIARPVPGIAPVHYPHARAARRCGFVVFEPDADGIMRRVPLVVRNGEFFLPQLAFGVAFDELGVTSEDVTAGPGRLTLRAGARGEAIHVQLDSQGRALVPWQAARDWTSQFGPHVPTGVAWTIFDRRLAIERNERQIVAALDALAAAGEAGAWTAYRDDLRRVHELRDERRLARYGGDGETLGQIDEWLAQYAALHAAEEPKLRAWVATRRRATPGMEGADPASQGGAPDQVRAALDALQRAFAANDEHAAEARRTLAWLQERLRGKIGLLGYTATALADMTPIPTHPRAPGVMAHANLLNGLLSGRMVWWAPWWLNAIVAFVMGLLSTIVSVRWGPRTAGLLALLAVLYAGLAGGLAFYAWTYWIAVTPVIGALMASYFAVVIHRYVFLERESRQIARALSQYTSATLARQMAEDAELCKRAEMREVSAIFTDLAGFTTISERIGAERTQRVLNISLGRFCDVMLRYEGMINKFIGDGIFAFWNPVIYPQQDHARRACATALELQEDLAALIAEQLAGHGDAIFRELVLRVGVATGNAVVGPCGSEQKYDYTCIGDSVNVAARLESANKFYGTRILVSGGTREQAGDDFAYRWLGGVQVKGKTQAVQVYELIGRRGQTDEPRLRYAERFAEGVAAFQQRDWAQAEQAFAACEQEQPTDRAAAQYRAATTQYAASPPGEDWNGALELTEK